MPADMMESTTENTRPRITSALTVRPAQN